MRTALVLFVVLAVSSAFAEKQPLERYQSIIDRQMFGPLPPGFDSTKLPSEVQKTSVSEKELTREQEQLKSAVVFSVVNVASDGQTQVGFTDNSDPKVPRKYFLRVGESRDGWTVKEADAEKATMTIAKGEVEVSLSLGGNSASDAAATARAGGTASAGPQPRRGAGLFGGSLLARRRQRHQDKAAQAAEQEKAAAAAAEKEAERQAQAEQEKQQREAERAEQRQQLLAIQEELKRVREAKAAAEKKEESSDAQNDSE